MKWLRKDVLAIEDMSVEEIRHILHTAKVMKEILMRPIKKLPTLKGKSVVNLFYEASTRTRTSFEMAGKVLGADTTSIAVAQSSVSKGESLFDTAKTIQAMRADLVIIRHPSSGSANFLADILQAGVINAGDGQHEHPTQALLDVFTMQERLGELEGKKVVIVGDVLHSRVARSNAWCLQKMGVDVTFVGPPTLVPIEMEGLGGVKLSHDLDGSLPGADIVMALRLQLERQKSGLFPSLREYSHLYGLTVDRLKKTGKQSIVLHPGPMNRGVEISDDVADGVDALIERQVTNGVAIRMALIYLLIGGSSNVVA
ncbi:aspartate carbamoyltransferase catalytic subunit [Desulfosporosinus sp. BICA1-9]|uniref:aspartate carbamoyltransferase catalytic subunit n=1 Tax=Desulfosporosinus sp. BICA1-9 TaxID=1531958 RepID=UPI00054B5332|nr:aspartate carbamoyltransferase catalytic subunit [Desulfosporosinus sp. BICA1-9]KJS79428.1 MAG: aspartate carbamoyltransferase [Desulfosporosinus sp. BICA1-9]KJS89453.1 MAG: aspartate carbamoyltransferase [Desulfosporosinus sp. BICA1-9]HBW37438.1 aspartate carbamoyltransferase catalytic subunit [Desulfosporosinus sp.]